MIKTTFEYSINGKKVKVLAKAKGVNIYEAKGLRILVIDKYDKAIRLSEEELDEVKNEATELMLQEKENNMELNFEKE